MLTTLKLMRTLPLLCILMACRPGDVSETGETALASLSAESGIQWQGVFDETTQLATWIDGLRDGPVVRAADAPQGPPDWAGIARAFLSAHPGLFGAAAIPDAIVVEEISADPLGGARVRFQLRAGGLRVDGGDALVTIGANGDVRAVGGAFPPHATLSADTQLDAATAVAAAELWVDAPVALSLDEPAELVALLVGDELRPAWRVVLAGDGGAVRRELWVDAAAGAILVEHDGVEGATVRGSGVGLDGARVPLDVYQASDGSFQLRDDGRGSTGIRTYTAQSTQRLPGAQVVSVSADSWDAAAVSAQAHAVVVYDWLQSTLDRRSIDGKGGGVRIVVHYGAQLANAFWDGHEAVFGDGDGVHMGPLPAGLDVVAHEMFHGVTQAESGLVYEGQSGALNESLSDVFGSLVELDHGGNWIMGDAVAPSGIRDLAHPEKTGSPASMSQYVKLPSDPQHDMGGVHVNSTIPSHAGYLVATAIGKEKMREIWWRAATRYLTARAKFSEFAQATRAAAEDLYGKTSAEAKAVAQAWRTVGVTR